MSAEPAEGATLSRELAALVVEALNLPMSPGDIDTSAPLFGEGLGLDSIDILEVALVIARQYGVELRADSEQNTEIFRSLDSLAAYVAAHRSR
jgi:acyl carrier protein